MTPNANERTVEATDGPAEPTADRVAEHPNATTTTDRFALADRLDGLAERPLAEHAAVFDEIHAELVRALSEIDGA